MRIVQFQAFKLFNSHLYAMILMEDGRLFMRNLEIGTGEWDWDGWNSIDLPEHPMGLPKHPLGPPPEDKL
jgi:hypothetical protein